MVDKIDFEQREISSLESRFRYQLQGLTDACKGFRPSVQVIDKVDELKTVCDRLRQSTKLALDCEGVRLGRDGKLTLIQLMVSEDTVYLINVLVLDNDAFKHGLKDIPFTI